MPRGKYGLLPLDRSAPKLKLSTLVPDATKVGAPPQVDYISEVQNWPMEGNDAVGDCVEAGEIHAALAATVYGLGAPFVPDDGLGLQLYEQWTGYNPNDPSTDQGTVIQDGLKHWHKGGIAGHTIAAYASVDVKDDNELQAALWLFGHLIGGFSVPRYAEDQFDAGHPWVLDSSGDGTIVGGHCVNLGAMDTTDAAGNFFKCVTWAAVQAISKPFFDKYFEEAWVVVTSDWISAASAKTPTGLDLTAFGQAYASLTGQPDPFGNVPPSPTPIPTPGPTPVVDQADLDVAPFMRRVDRHPFHIVTHHDQELISAWLTDKGLA